MDKMLPSRVGKLRIICSLPLFSDAICIKRQSAAEHGFTQTLLSLILARRLNFTTEVECKFVELSIFAELPKVYLGDPSYYLRARHPEANDIYTQVRGKIWRETEAAFHTQTTRSDVLYGLHDLLDAYSAMLFIEKECLLGNQYFASERHRTRYDKKRKEVLSGKSIQKPHPAVLPLEGEESLTDSLSWLDVVAFLDELYEESTRARLEGGLSEYATTLIGMMEKLKEHYRYKGWNYHYSESVGEHTYQVIFLTWVLSNMMNLTCEQRLQVYRSAALHDLAEAYASDVIYPVKVREKELGALHKELEDKVIEDLCEKYQIHLEDDPFYHAMVEACDRFSAQLYFDREQRAGNSDFNIPNLSMENTRKRWQSVYPQIFECLDILWEEYVTSLNA